MYELISIPQVAIHLLPLNLPSANGINNGGYKIPVFSGDWRKPFISKNDYSPIDLLVAGIEAQRRDIIITSLVSFFDKNRSGFSSESEIYLTLLNNQKLLIKNISWLKYISKEDKQLYKLMLRNAPLTFKWI